LGPVNASARGGRAIGHLSTPTTTTTHSNAVKQSVVTMSQDHKRSVALSRWTLCCRRLDNPSYRGSAVAQLDNSLTRRRRRTSSINWLVMKLRGSHRQHLPPAPPPPLPPSPPMKKRITKFQSRQRYVAQVCIDHVPHSAFLYHASLSDRPCSILYHQRKKLLRHISLPGGSQCKDDLT